MICISGSEICSLIFLSTSVFSPTRTSLAFLPSFFVISRTIRFILWNVPSNGTMRRAMTLSCSSPLILCSCREAFWKFSSSSPLRSGFCVTIAAAMTSSPTRSIRRSSFSTFTLIICDSCASCFAAAGFGFAKGPGTGTIGGDGSAATTACCTGEGQYSHSETSRSSFTSKRSTKIVCSNSFCTASNSKSVVNHRRNPSVRIISTAFSSSRSFSGR